MPKLKPIQNFVFTGHAMTEMARRGISESEVAEVLTHPEQTEMVRSGRAVYQAKLDLGEPPKTYILRVFVEIDRTSPQVVTVYRTSKIEKYWR
jgi:hypothetical protein